MLKHLVFLVFLIASAGAHAEVFMCKKSSGETEFSDTPCKAGSSSEVVPDRDNLTKQQQEDAQQKLQEQRREANESATQRSAAQENQEPRAEQTPPPPDVVYEGGGCNEGIGRGSNCAGDLYGRPIPDRTPDTGVRPRPGGRPKPAPR